MNYIIIWIGSVLWAALGMIITNSFWGILCGPIVFFILGSKLLK